MLINWEAFLQVFVAAIVGAAIVVTFYSLGLRLLVTGGRPPLVSPAEFTDAITVITDKQRRRAEKAPTSASACAPPRCSVRCCSSCSTTEPSTPRRRMSEAPPRLRAWHPCSSVSTRPPRA